MNWKTYTYHSLLCTILIFDKYSLNIHLTYKTQLYDVEVKHDSFYLDNVLCKDVNFIKERLPIFCAPDWPCHHVPQVTTCGAKEDLRQRVQACYQLVQDHNGKVKQHGHSKLWRGSISRTLDKEKWLLNWVQTLWRYSFAKSYSRMS